MSFKSSNRLLSAALLIGFAAFTRLFPHYPNFTAVGAMALFGGTMISNKKVALVLPLVALLLSDVCLQLFTSTKGFYGSEQFFVYASFLLITWLATFIRKKNVANLVFAGVWTGVVFFLTTNFGVWVIGDYYPKTFMGLMESYFAAIPFYKGEFLGSFFLNIIFSNLFYGTILFGAYYLLERRQLAETKA